MKDFKKDALDTHNEFRAKHGAPTMKWSSKLEARAQKWANEIANKGYLQHDSQKEDGENIACMKGMEFFIFRTFAFPNSSLTFDTMALVLLALLLQLYTLHRLQESLVLFITPRPFDPRASL